jgi:hypothetical protein
MPTSVIVTVLVAALSVWVAPAFTRQWEDRKQARALQAEVAEQISLAAAQLASRLEVAALSNGEPDERERRSIRGPWALAHTQIEAKLRVYFSPEILTLWVDFDGVIGPTTNAILVSRLPNPERHYAYMRSLFRGNERIVPFAARLGAVSPNLRAAEALLTKRRFDLNPEPASQLGAKYLALAVQDIADAIIERLMTADPETFSTTRGDLLRDLLP